MRKHGLTADNLLSADVVTADGRLVHASEDENPELFWGIRGGGGNFGIVTSFDYRVHPVGPTVLAGAVFYPGDYAGDILRFYREWVEQAARRADDADQPRHRPARAVPARGRPRPEGRRGRPACTPVRSTRPSRRWRRCVRSPRRWRT